MLIGGLEKLSLIDYPDHLAAIIFTQGCNFRCQFCYNPMLVLPNSKNKLQKDHLIPEKDLFAFLRDRVKKLDGVVITGGEPTLHQDLPEFIKKIRSLGYLIKLDTNGTNPDMVTKLIKDQLIDYIAMDLKAPRNKYEEVVGVPIDFSKIAKSVKIIKASKLPHEFRTTVAPNLLNQSDIIAMAEFLAGDSKWYLQEFQSDKDLINKEFEGSAMYSRRDLQEMAEQARKYVKNCRVR
ncbi:MAG: anaerobic ribonucleoside-triphosphate reductase activating protein [bacterium]